MNTSDPISSIVVRAGVWLVPCLVFLSGCGGHPVSTTQQPQPIQTFDEVYTRQNRAICSLAFRCCPAEISARLVPGATDETSCNAYYENYKSVVLGSINDSQAAGRISLDTTAAATCLQGLETISCADFFSKLIGRRESSCVDLAATRLVPEGGKCVSLLDCPGYCDTQAGNVCKPRVAANMPCTTNLMCDSDSNCATISPDTGMSLPTAICLPRRAAGMACTQADDCASLACTSGVCQNALCGG